MHALNLGDVKSALLLVKNGADISGSIYSVHDVLQLTINCACQRKANNAAILELIQELIRHGYDANKVLANFSVYVTSEFDHNLSSEIIKLSLKCGANPSYITSPSPNYSHTPLSLAVTYGNKEAVKILLDAGADLNQKVGSKSYSQSPLSIAINSENTEIIEILVAHGADLNRKVVIQLLVRSCLFQSQYIARIQR